MTQLIQWLCRRMLEAERIEPDTLAAQIGTTRGAALPSLPIVVTPRDPQVAEARVVSSPQSGEASDVVLIPAGPLTLAELSGVFGPYEESPRLHPGRPRKLLFSPARDGEHPYVVRLIAEIAADETANEAAKVERVIVTRAPAAEGPAVTSMSDVTEEQAPVWPRLLGQRASFGVRSWRAATLDSVRQEIEQTLGVRFARSADKIYDGAQAFECSTPACELRLNCWPANAADLLVFNLIGVPSEDVDAPPPERIGDALAAHLRSRGRDWYVPDRLELLEEGGLLGERHPDRDAIVAILAARWLAFSTPEQRNAGVQLLGSIVDLWLATASRTSDPVADLSRQRRELETWGKGVDPDRRADILASYTVQEQLSVIEEELFELGERSRTERVSSPSVAARLAELRRALPALRGPASQLGVNSIARQYDRVEAALDRLLSDLRG